MKTFTDAEIRAEIAHLKRGYAPRLREMVESLLAERQTIAAGALERSAQVCDEYLKGPIPASSGVLYVSKKIRSMIPGADAEARKVVEDAERWQYGRKEGFPFQWQINNAVKWSMPGEETDYQSPEEAIDAARRKVGAVR